MKLIETTEEDYYICDRCDIDSLNKGTSWCPCPRGSCEARIAGTIVTEKKLNLEITAEQKKWNEENYRS